MSKPAPQDTFARAIQSPFPRLRVLLEGVEPGRTPTIDMTVGEPRHTPPAFFMERLVAAQGEIGKYPPIAGTPELRQAIAAWIGRRYGIEGEIDAENHVVPLCGSREGLFSAVFPALDRREKLVRPAVLIPNPFYQVYIAATLAAGAEPVFLPAAGRTGFLPDLDRLENDKALLSRTIAFYLCSPSNPQGAVADAAYLEKAIHLARVHNFMLLADECYSEVYADKAPPGALEIAVKRSGSLANVVSFNSLSKRSNLAGARSGFSAGDADFIKRLLQFRNVMAPQMPIPIMAASAAAWQDEAHVEESRRLYQRKFRLAAEILGNRLGGRGPEGGFFLWLDVSRIGGGEKGSVTLWQRSGVRVLPGAYLTHASAVAEDPGRDFVRIALVHDLATTEEALKRIASVLE